MSATAQCPSCHTRFNVTDAQLSAHDGLVRCGRCQTVFNASEQIELELAKLQLVLPIESEPVAVTQDETPAPALVTTSPESTLNEVDHAIVPLDLDANSHIIINKNKDLKNNLTFNSPISASVKIHRWPWIMGSGLLILFFFLQSIFYFRSEIALRLPASKTLLVALCTKLGCEIELPRTINLFSIESSDMAAEPTHPNQVILSALLHNMAAYPQAFPWLALSLTDANDQLQARHLFRPKDYLKKDENELAGMVNNHEIEIKLHLDTTDLNSAGYKLFLFYPPKK